MLLLVAGIAEAILTSPFPVEHGEIRVTTAEELTRTLKEHAGTPGPPLLLVLDGAASFAGAGTGTAATPALQIERPVAIRGVRNAELSLGNRVEAWRLGPGATLTLWNLTLSNLGPRPASAPPPPPSNVSIFTFPLWFFQANRSASAEPQIALGDVGLVVPFDEFLVLQHILIEAAVGDEDLKPGEVDPFEYFERVLSHSLHITKAALRPSGAVEVVEGRGLGMEFRDVDFTFVPRRVPLATNRSRIMSSNPYVVNHPPMAPGEAGSAAALPPWAIALAAIGAVAALLLVAAAAGWVFLGRARRHNGGGAAKGAAEAGTGESGDGSEGAASGGGEDDDRLEAGLLRKGPAPRSGPSAGGRSRRDQPQAAESLSATGSQENGNGAGTGTTASSSASLVGPPTSTATSYRARGRAAQGVGAEARAGGGSRSAQPGGR